MATEAKRMIIESSPAGNSGMHQMGFARYARIILDCGHRTTVTYWLSGDRPDGRQVNLDSFPEVGQDHDCPVCRKRGAEQLNGAFPKPTPDGWGCVSDVIARLGMTSDEFYAAAWNDQEFNLAVGRLAGCGSIYGSPR